MAVLRRGSQVYLQFCHVLALYRNIVVSRSWFDSLCTIPLETPTGIPPHYTVPMLVFLEFFPLPLFSYLYR